MEMLPDRFVLIGGMHVTEVCLRYVSYGETLSLVAAIAALNI